jgi:hypothetical protein
MKDIWNVGLKRKDKNHHGEGFEWQMPFLKTLRCNLSGQTMKVQAGM